eukprot:1234206-Amorphochlora_amoeboformis.AAC.2
MDLIRLTRVRRTRFEPHTTMRVSFVIFTSISALATPYTPQGHLRFSRMGRLARGVRSRAQDASKREVLGALVSALGVLSAGGGRARGEERGEGRGVRMTYDIHPEKTPDATK